MDDRKHNESASSYPSTSASSMSNNNDLFTSAEKTQLHSFLGTFNPTTDETHANSLSNRYNAGGRNDHYSTVTPSSPTPVLLSPPFSRNSTFGQQHLQTLPILDGQQQQQAAYRKYSTDNNKREMEEDHNGLDTKKYRLLLDDSTIASPMNRSSTFNDTDHRHFTMEAASSPTSSSSPPPPPQSKPKGSGRGRKPAHELLSDNQKKANHIASEQKRRANIRIGFDQLVGIVPNLSECQRSESLILHKSADYIRQLVDTKNSLRDRVRELQIALGEVPDEDSSEGEMDYGF